MKGLIKQLLREELNKTLQKYDVVGTIKPEPNGFYGLGVVEKISGDVIYISTIPTWIKFIVHDNMTGRLNTIKTNVNNIKKINNSNIEGYSYDSQNKYKMYLNVLKNYLHDKYN